MSGDVTITVLSDPFERVVGTAEVTDRDLSDAHDRYEPGDLVDSRLQWVHRVWLSGDGDARPGATGEAGDG